MTDPAFRLSVTEYVRICQRIAREQARLGFGTDAILVPSSLSQRVDLRSAPFHVYPLPDVAAYQRRSSEE